MTVHGPGSQRQNAPPHASAFRAISGGSTPSRLVLLVGVPRSGTSVLHAMMSTAPGSSRYAGEASYLRLLLGVLPRAEALFDVHTRYVFHTSDALRSFHANLLEQALAAYAAAAGGPDCLIVKDPLMTPMAGEFRALIPRTEVALILRHPADVIASRLKVQDGLGVPRNPDRLINEHNEMLQSVLDDWARVRPNVVTYPMLAQPSLTALRNRLGMPGINAALLWQNAAKIYPGDGQPGWMTPLYGAPAQANERGRATLPTALRERIAADCLPICRAVLTRARLTMSRYWSV